MKASSKHFETNVIVHVRRPQVHSTHENEPFVVSSPILLTHVGQLGLRAVHRRDALRCEKILENRLLAHEKINVLWDSAIDEILGDENPLGVTGARIKNTKTGDTHEVEADGVFIAIGHAPSTDLFTEQLETKQGGYLITADNSTATSIPGVYAAGDVTDDIYRQAVTAAGMGCMAALEAEKYLAEMEAEKQAAE